VSTVPTEAAEVADVAGPAVDADAGDPSAADRRRLLRLLIVVGLVVTAWTSIGAFARATYNTRTTADEPQYLLSAISLARDGNLDIADELRVGAYVGFHERRLPEQTKLLDDGRRVSPHDPLLPALLAGPMVLGGWVAAKLTLAALAGLLAASMIWVAVRRFGVATPLATTVVVAFAAVSPLVVYGTQVYPELPAALAVTAAVGAVTAAPTRRRAVLVAVALAALPWLALKYAPVVGALGLVVAWSWGWQRRAVRPVLVIAATVVANLVAFAIVHKVVYTGWTAYAAGDHFVGGELTVMGVEPDYASRSVRVVNLLVDRQFGLAAWAPIFLFAVPALAALARRRPPGSLALALPLAAGWLNATFVALTMHGWWWPGRQVVIVVPCVVLAVAWFAQQVRAPALVAGATDQVRRRWAVWRSAGFVALAASVLAWAWLLVEVLRVQRALVVDFAESANPVLQVWQELLPDGQRNIPTDRVLVWAWVTAFVALAWCGWRSVRAATAPKPGAGPRRSDGDEDAGAGELADAHVLAVDLDRGGAVR
jgi:hypothetical protein